jgi:hypothetical protein
LSLLSSVEKQFVTVGEDFADFFEDVIEFDFDLPSVFFLFFFEL